MFARFKELGIVGESPLAHKRVGNTPTGMLGGMSVLMQKSGATRWPCRLHGEAVCQGTTLNDTLAMQRPVQTGGVLAVNGVNSRSRIPCETGCPLTDAENKLVHAWKPPGFRGCPVASDGRSAAGVSDGLMAQP